MRILYLSFYFEPDLSAGSFRNTSLAKELAKQCAKDCHIDLITSKPNRYNTFRVEALSKEEVGNITVHRIDLPSHKNGMLDQVHSFREYFVFCASYTFLQIQGFFLSGNVYITPKLKSLNSNVQ